MAQTSAIYGQPLYGQAVYGQIVKSAADTVGVSVSEASDFATVQVSANDTLNVEVGSTNSRFVYMTRPDTLATVLTEARSFGTVAVTGSDAVDAGLADLASVISFFSAADTLGLSLTENGNRPPTAPTIISPANGEPTSPTSPTFDWTFNDQPGDVQGAFQFRRRKVFL